MTNQAKETVIVVGGGPAGLMAAGAAAEAGVRVVLLEKMPRLGRKLLLTGKGRCNLTNTVPMPDFIENYPRNGSFLYGALSIFNNEALLAFFTSQGMPTKVERGGRVFPASDRSVDVLRALERYVKTNGVEIEIGQSVQGIRVEKVSSGETQVQGVITDRREYWGKAVIIATGGLSYPATGSTGDGYQWAQQLGHTVVRPRPGLVPLEIQENWVKDVQGLTLKNVRVTAWFGNPGAPKARCIGEEFGEMLFTHFGVSGPIILSLSSSIAPLLPQTMPNKSLAPGKVTNEIGAKIHLCLNLKPALTMEQLDQRLQRDLTTYARKQFKNALGDLLPRALIPIIVSLSKIPAEKYVHQITREERHQLLTLLTDLRLTVTNTRPLAEAIVTTGGVSVKEIDPRTMASRRVNGLYFAGEVIDIDGYTGGFNLQAAFSTGYVAGKAAAKAIQALEPKD